MKNIRLVILLFFVVSILRAQAPVFMGCPGQVNVQDNTDNNALFWNHIELWDPNTQSHDLADAPVDLEAYVSKGCPNLIGYTTNFTLFLDLDGNGSQETEVNGNTFYTPGTVLYNNTNGGSGTSILFDNRAVSDLDKYRFRLKSTQVNDSVYQLKVIWIDGNGTETKPLLPYGLHRVEWRFSNACNQTVTCGSNFLVKDGEKPTIVSVSGSSLNLLGAIPTSLWASDVLLNTGDNYTPLNLIKVGIRRVGQPDGQGNVTGFPRNSDGTPQVEVTFTCEDISTPQIVQLWAMDSGNNAAFSESSVSLFDNSGFCAPYLDTQNPVRVRVTDAICPEVFVEEVSFGGENYVINNGDFVLSGGAIGTSKTITPETSYLDHLDGVSTWDLLLISRHILNISLLDSPYKIIAADANQSGTVTTFDIVELRKLILGTYNELPYSASSIFVNKNQVFPNPLNPFTEPLQNSVTIVVDSINPLVEFVAIKIGNVEGCSWNFKASASDRSVISLPDYLMEAGQIVEVTFPGNNNFYAWQMTLAMNGLEIVEIIPFNGLSMENFGVFEQNDSTYLTFSTEAPEKYFNLRLKALQSGMLSSMLHISNTITPSFSYDSNGVPSPITLEFTSNTRDIPTLFASLTPNPWTNEANFQFSTEQAGTGDFTVTNALGQVVYTAQQTFPTGPNSISLNRQQIPVAGMYWCRLALNGQVRVAKMILK